ncbi:MAG: alpha/beta fold hydrolase [Proteobacteria bacterium]|nr:alpha/beta fold hydrolase [Pseudomonadota bacterium]
MTSRALLVVLALLTAACTVAPQPAGNGSALPATDSMDAVVKRTFTSYGFTLESGTKLPETTLAFETYGRLSPDGRNAILIVHGFTSNEHAAGKYTPGDRASGWWDNLIGPGKAIDTTKYFVVASNMLGSSNGSTAPASLDPRTGTRYGPDFPDITVRDMVRAQKTLLEGLGVRHLVAVAGPSYGGRQVFQWGVTYPTFMAGLVSVVSSPKNTAGPAAVENLVRRLATDPNWNGGWHYDRGGIPATLTELRFETLKRYGSNEILATQYPDQSARDAEIRRRAVEWATRFDPNSMIALQKASVKFNAEPELGKIRAKVLYVLSRTDKLFPPSIAPDVMDKLAKAGVDAKYVEIDTEFGHSATNIEAAKWGPAMKVFIEGLEK